MSIAVLLVSSSGCSYSVVGCLVPCRFMASLVCRGSKCHIWGALNCKIKCAMTISATFELTPLIERGGDVFRRRQRSLHITSACAGKISHLPVLGRSLYFIAPAFTLSKKWEVQFFSFLTSELSEGATWAHLRSLSSSTGAYRGKLWNFSLEMADFLH